MIPIKIQKNQIPSKDLPLENSFLSSKHDDNPEQYLEIKPDDNPEKYLDYILTNQKSQIYGKHDPESSIMSACKLDIEKDENFTLDESVIGEAPFYKKTFFIFQLFFVHFLKFLLHLSSNVIKKGKLIRLKDLQLLTNDQKINDDLHTFIDRFQEVLRNNNGKITEWQFAKIIMRLFKRMLLLSALFWTIHNGLCFTFTIFIEKLLESQDSPDEKHKTFYWAMALSVGFFLQYSLGSWGWYMMAEFNTKFRLMLINSLYLKIMKLNNYTVQKANIGKIINIIANDMNAIEFKIYFLIHLIATPPTLVLSIYLLWRKLGPLCFITIPIISFIYFVQRTFSSLNVKNIKQKNIFSDQRMKFCNELIEGIRLLKIYAWEMRIKKFIDEIRKKEVEVLKKYSYFIYADRALSVNSSYITSFVLFFVFYSVSDKETVILTPAFVFSVYQLMEYIRTYQVVYFGYGLSFFFEFKVIIRRIIDILTLKEPEKVSSSNEAEEKKINLDKNCDLIAENFSSFWDVDPSCKPVLKNINMKVEKGKTYGIFGKVGSGKSSFFYSLLKETPKRTGNLNFNPNIAYVEQEPFIIHGSIRNNILFFKEFDEVLYKEVLKACCLEEDLVNFPNSDLTEIGERGINLSGGQKARICLARAFYSQAELYLLDDPLSALDAKVGKKIFDIGIKKFLKSKTVILITHQIQFLKNVDYIYLFDKGEITKEGTFSEFKNDLSNYFENSKNQEKEKKDEIKPPIKNDEVVLNENFKKIKKLYENQENEESRVNLNTYIKYFSQSKSTSLIIFTVVLFFIFEVSKYFITYLYSHFDDYGTFTENEIFLGAFIIIIIQIMVAFLKYICFIRLVVNSNFNIHNKMTECVVRAPSLFFDTHDSGSILNRFSNDINLMDTLLILTLVDFFDLTLYFFAAIIISGTINLWFYIPGAISLVVLIKIFLIGKPVILGLKKLDLQNKSPLFGVFSSTLAGLSTINVYKRNQNFVKQYAHLIENSARSNYNFWEVSRGFGFCIESISKIISIVGLFTTLAISDEHSGVIGQQIVYLILISESLQWGLRQGINADSVMNSTMRALKYTEIEPEDLLYKEKDQEITSYRKRNLHKKQESAQQILISNIIDKANLVPFESPPAQMERWPSKGSIIFKNVFLRYREGLDYTLNGLTFEIMPGEKVGVVGRTGAGKSSIIQALFRTVEISEGIIEIDGVNTKEIGLHTLRGNLSIIPQNSFIFAGTVKRNIDPLENYTTENILKVLKDVELKDHIDQLEKGIDADMSNAKSVFSVGQMQLLCLARAILKQNKILVLDEATANVDFNTDIILQKAIKEIFNGCTIITIAHRLLTIADYDKVLVMDKGCVVEYDHPFLLLTDKLNPNEITKNGYFADMVKSMGVETSKKMLNITRDSYEKKCIN